MAYTAVSELKSRRKLILHDSLAFLALIAITGVLLALTLFLFRSFMSHRASLGQSWNGQGRAALLEHQPQQAVAAFRAALSYAPGDHGDEILLAQALAAAGHTDEAYNYYRELWEVHPGDGSVNLQLARLAAKKRQSQDAINFYRASLYGTWEGDGIQRRRAVRLELAEYLIQEHQPAAARAELLVASGNAPDTPATDLTLAKMLEQAGAAPDAMDFYQKALAQEPKNLEALQGAGRLAYNSADYATARALLQRAAQAGPLNAQDAFRLSQAQRLRELAPSETLPLPERMTRILSLRRIAKTRLDSCPAMRTDTTLQARWTGPDGTANRSALTRDPKKEAATLQLIYDTELAASKSGCPAATGDDALLLLLARSAAPKEQEEAAHR